MSDPRVEWTVEQWREKYPPDTEVRCTDSDKSYKVIGFSQPTAAGVRVHLLNVQWDAGPLDIMEPWTGSAVSADAGMYPVRLFPCDDGKLVELRTVYTNTFFDADGARQMSAAWREAVQYLEGLEK